MPKISELPSAEPLAGDEETIVLQGGAVKRAPLPALGGDVATKLSEVVGASLRAAPVSLIERHGGKTVQASGNVNAVARAYDCDSQFAPAYIDGVRALIVPASDSILIAKVWERPDTSGSINAAPGQSEDVLVATGTTTAAAFLQANNVVAVTRYLARDGYSYFVAIESYEADGVTREPFAFNYRDVPNEEQRFEGYDRTGSGGYANFNSTRSISIGLVTSELIEVSKQVTLDLEDFKASQEANYRAMLRENDAALIAQCTMDPIGAGVSVRFAGDSLCQQTIGSPTRRSSDVVASLLSGSTVLNVGVGGETSEEINDRLAARTSGEWAFDNFVNAMTNDDGDLTYSQSVTEIGAIIANFTGEWMFSPAIDAPGLMQPTQRRMLAELRATHGARIYNWEQSITARYEVLETDGETSTAATRTDGLHLSSYGCYVLGLDQTRIIRAMNGRAPFVHEEILPLRAGDAAGTSYSGGLVLGSVGNAVITGGFNADGAIDVDPETGALKRGAGVLQRASRELIVEASNEYGSHAARKVFLACRDTADTDPRHQVRLFGNDQQCPILQPTNDGSAPIADTTRFSVFIAARFIKDWGGSVDPEKLLAVKGETFRMEARYANNSASVASNANLPTASNPFKINGYFVSVDTVAGTIIVATNEASESVSITADSRAIRMSNIDRLFMSTGDYLRGIALSRYMLFTGKAFDFTDSAVRALFYDSATELPKDIGGTGTVDSTQAVVDLFGREGDWFLGNSAGSVTLLPNVYRGYRNLGVRDIA